jgi:hypothetical protein
MTGMLLAISLLLIPLALASESPGAPRTMRLDYYHTGDATRETFSLDRVVREPLPWPGNPRKAIDDTNLGKYFFEVIDQKSGKVIYSRGFASIYGEWETTDEAGKVTRTFSESLRFPAPDATVRINLKKRDRDNSFKQVWSTILDPKDQFVDDAKPPSAGPLSAIQNTGDPSVKVDFLIIGDGYTAAERGKFEKDARRLVDLLFATSPFKERRSDFNVWGLCPAAAESGISRPSTGIHRRSPLGATYDAFGSERYVLTFENRAFRDYASNAPYDFVEILVNGKTYGGGGIFGLYSTVAADSMWAPYVFVHEFGHHFAALADEYYTSPVAYSQPTDLVEPWEPNVTALLDAGNLKWKDLVSPGTPIPTPWKKQDYEEYSRVIQKWRGEIRAQRQPESVMDNLFIEEKQHDVAMFSAEKYSGRVGAFEGANYEAKGYYRPQLDCIMFSRNDAGFCAVCRRAIERVIDLYTSQ